MEAQQLGERASASDGTTLLSRGRGYLAPLKDALVAGSVAAELSQLSRVGGSPRTRRVELHRVEFGRVELGVGYRAVLYLAHRTYLSG